MNGFVPQGSYQQSCNDISVVLSCQAMQTDGGWINASFDLTNTPNAELWNDNGVLKNGASAAPNGYLPAGSYVASCRNVRVLLSCNARRKDGSFVASQFDLTDVLQADLSNDDGVLLNGGMASTPVPDITTPLLRSPDNQAGLVPPLASLGELQALIGTWNSPRGAAATGYNVMPLPQQTAPNGYILKDFSYYEEITFATIAGSVANRGGDFTQTANTLFYEQRVYFAENPQPPPAAQVKDQLVHAENGAWLHLAYGPQQNGPYGPGTLPRNSEIVPQQPTATAYVKQVSVPHGNSILAVGSATPILNGKPVFPSANRSIPPFTDASIIDPNSKLQAQLDALAARGVHVVSGSMIQVSSDPSIGGNVADIQFEQRRATVSGYDSTWYIEHLSDGTTQLQYSQTMHMKLLIKGVLTDFLHIDANTLVRAA